jgi:transcriptional regulator with XRE-family HTH domain
MNQSDFAERVGASTTTVSRWIHGRVPQAKYIDPISDVLVLDYDLVATKAGYRPAIHEVPPDSREARAAHLVSRIDWDAPGAEAVVSMLEQFAMNAPKRGRE